MNYFKNLWLWAAGIVWLWTKEHQNGDIITREDWETHNYIHYKEGFSPLLFLFPYITTYMANVVFLGGAVVSVSRMSYERRSHEPWRTINKYLNKLDAQHGEESGLALWGSVPCRDRTRYLIIGTWILIAAYFIIT